MSRSLCRFMVLVRASFHLGNSARTSWSGILQRWQRCPCGLDRSIVFSSFPFATPETLDAISRSATPFYPIHYRVVFVVAYDRLLEKIALKGEWRGDLAMIGSAVCSGLILLMYENKRSMFWTKSRGSWLNVTFGKSFMICLATRNLEKLTPLFPSSASTYLRTCTSFARVSLPSRFLPSTPEYASFTNLR